MNLIVLIAFIASSLVAAFGQTEGCQNKANDPIAQASSWLETALPNNDNLSDNIKVAKLVLAQTKQENFQQLAAQVLSRFVQLEELEASKDISCNLDEVVRLTSMSRLLNEWASCNSYREPQASQQRLNRLVIGLQQAYSTKCFQLWHLHWSQLSFSKLEFEQMRHLLIVRDHLIQCKPYGRPSQAYTGFNGQLDLLHCAAWHSAKVDNSDGRSKDSSSVEEQAKQWLQMIAELSGIEMRKLRANQLAEYLDTFVGGPCRFLDQKNIQMQQLLDIILTLAAEVKLEDSMVVSINNPLMLIHATEQAACQKFYHLDQAHLLHEMAAYLVFNGGK